MVSLDLSPTTHLKKTSLYQMHLALGAKMTPFAGWEMPLQYGKIEAEHRSVRAACGLFDVSHMGLIVVRSGDIRQTVRFLEPLVPRDLGKLLPGKAVYTQFLNESGGILDDLIIYRLPEVDETIFPFFDEFLIIGNAANTDQNILWMEAHRSHFPQVQVEPFNHSFSLLALQGPQFGTVLNQMGCPPEFLPGKFWMKQLNVAGISVLAARTGYTGEDGVELVVPNGSVHQVWESLIIAMAPLGGLPVGLAARDTLRLEAALPLHGQDISADITPLEAGLQWSVDFGKPFEFMGRSALLQQQKKGLERTALCFKMKKNSIPRAHDVILLNGQPIGEVTSGSISWMLGVAIGMGLVKTSVKLHAGDSLQIQSLRSAGIRERIQEAEVVLRPFYKASC